jgi:transposase
MKFKRIAIDTSKHVFTLHGVDEQDRPVLRRELKRVNLESFFAAILKALIAFAVDTVPVPLRRG